MLDQLVEKQNRLSQASGERGSWFWVWHEGCAVDPYRICSSQNYPQPDVDGYYHGRFLAPCMSVPFLVFGRTRGHAKTTYNYVWNLYRDMHLGLR